MYITSIDKHARCRAFAFPTTESTAVSGTPFPGIRSDHLAISIVSVRCFFRPLRIGAIS